MRLLGSLTRHGLSRVLRSLSAFARRRWMVHLILAILPQHAAACADKGSPMRRLEAYLKEFAGLLAAVFSTLLIGAQDAHSCEIRTSENTPPREIITCGDAVTIEREPAAELQITERPNEAAPRVIEVQGGAILINISPGHSPTEVRTPHAIATVRGTTYVVDAGAEQTSVFVLEGGVNVRRPNDPTTVTLEVGEGTDVTPGEPLAVRKWGAARAEALLARFGR